MASEHNRDQGEEQSSDPSNDLSNDLSNSHGDNLGGRGLAKEVDLQCDEIERKRHEQTDKMRLLLLKLNRLDKPKADLSAR